MTGILVGVGLGVVLVLGFMATAVKIIREYQRVVLFRLGRSVGERGPGFKVINPITDRVSWVDLREQYLEIPHQTAITRDNAPINIDFIIFFRVLSKREQMNDVLRVKLDEVTERWGVKVTNVEVREINPPPGVLEAMTRQMSAERTRRAVVTEAEGQKEASITVAEGQKQSSILSAEGQRQAEILRAEGFSLALETIFQAARGVDGNTMTLQYLDTLRQIGASPSTKFVVPVELSGLLAGLTTTARRAVNPGPDGAGQEGV
jgi:regulator of protease activity HflC (stomatin/prohibitin superfamily)